MNSSTSRRCFTNFLSTKVVLYSHLPFLSLTAEIQSISSIQIANSSTYLVQILVKFKLIGALFVHVQDGRWLCQTVRPAVLLIRWCGVFNPPESTSKATPWSRSIKLLLRYGPAGILPQHPSAAGAHALPKLTPRISGVCCDALTHQINYLQLLTTLLSRYLIHTGKGADAIISMLHHFF